MADWDWNYDPVVLAQGGLQTAETIDDLTNGLAGKAMHVFEAESTLLHQRDPGLGIDEIEFLVTRSSRAAASAYAQGGRRAVMLSTGLLNLLWRQVAVAAHLPTVLPEAHPHKGVPPDWCNDADALVPDLDDWQVDNERGEYLVEIFFHMLAYIIDHEIAHHVRRHLILMRSATGLALTTDGHGDPLTPGMSLLMQDVEFDADAGALNNMLLSTDQSQPFDQEWTVGMALEYGFQLAFGQILVAQVMDPKPGPVARSDDLHPAPILRAINFTNLVFRSLADLVPGDWNEYREMHDIAWNEASRVAAHQGLLEGQWCGDGIDPAIYDHFLTIEQRYFDVRERINAMLDAEDGA